jgi:transcriptional regulator with XRE-family HTH domain
MSEEGVFVMDDNVAFLAITASDMRERAIAVHAVECTQAQSGERSVPPRRQPGHGRGAAPPSRPVVGRGGAPLSRPVATRNRLPRASDIKPQVGERLRWVRELIDENRTRLARQYRVHHTVWEKWERGATYPDPAVMVRFCFDWGVTMDWIYRGLVAGMDEKIRRSLIDEHPQIASGLPPPARAEPRASPASGRRRSPEEDAPKGDGPARSGRHPSLPLPAPSRHPGSDAREGSGAKDPSASSASGSRGRPAGRTSKAAVRRGR